MNTSIRFPESAMLLAMLLTFNGLQAVKAQFTTKNSFVEAEVTKDGNGFITIHSFDASSLKQELTFNSHSYLTINLGGTFFTNNPNAPRFVEPSGNIVTPFPLTGGSSTLLTGATPGMDTIRTDWILPEESRIHVVQDVYPAQFANAGQIVVKISVIDDSTEGSVSAQAQLLLDLSTSSSSAVNDDPKVTTREGYNENAGQDVWHTLRTLPPYYLTSENDICTKNFPGIVAVGYSVDDLAPGAMGLMKPSEMAIVGWEESASEDVWGFDPANEGIPMGADNAMLLQWPAVSVASNSEEEIACTSYGTAPCSVCLGNLNAITLHPDHIVWNGTSYVPNHFPVEGIVWNSNTGSTATQTVGTQSISSDGTAPLQIVAPSPIANYGGSQTHAITRGGGSEADSLVDECGASFITWEDTVLQNVLVDCATDSMYDINFSLSATGVGSTGFLGSCSCPILVDCEIAPDTVPGIPNITVLSRSGSFDGSECNARVIEAQASDPRMCFACFVKSVSAVQLQNMTFAVEDSASWKFRMNVIDSMQNGSATIVALDNEAGVSDTAVFTYCTIPDTHAPLLRVIAYSPSTHTFGAQITDSQAWDRGLDTIYIGGFIGSSPFGSLRGSNGITFFLPQVFDTLCLTAIDLAGHRIDTCFVFESAGISSVQFPAIDLHIAPNPASGVATISLTGAPSANLEIFERAGPRSGELPHGGKLRMERGHTCGRNVYRAGGSGRRGTKQASYEAVRK